MATQVPYPFTSFNFSVEINVPFIGPKLCNAAFSDCDGLDMSMDVKTIREVLELALPTSLGDEQHDAEEREKVLAELPVG